MKKSLKITVIIIIMSLIILIGCVEVDSDDYHEEKIIGTWQGTPEEDPNNLSIQITFFPDKTAFFQSTVKGETIDFNCTWVMENSTVLISYQGKLSPYEINLSNDNILILKETNSGIIVNLKKQ